MQKIENKNKIKDIKIETKKLKNIKIGDKIKKFNQFGIFFSFLLFPNSLYI